MQRLRIGKGAPAAEECQPHSAFVADRVGHDDAAHLAGAVTVRRAAGAAVRLLNPYKADGRTDALGMLAERQITDRILALIERRVNGQVAEDIAVCCADDFRELFLRERRVEVDRCAVRRKVEAHVVHAVVPIGGVGEQMLARMLLHKVEAARPVQRERIALPDSERAVDVVQKLSVLFIAAENDRVPEPSRVRRLSARIVKDDGLVKRHVIARVRLFDPFDRRLAGRQVAVLQIEPFCHIRNLRSVSS